ncbi:hypothetical protein QN416_25680, partial [Glaciimonas sp. Cout2]
YFKDSGHKLVPLFQNLFEVSKRRGFEIEQPSNRGEPETLAFLDEFATRDRYYNLNSLSSTATTSQPIADPVRRWYALVFAVLTEKE